MAQPLYQQIKNDLLEKIRTGVFQPNDRIPSEHHLANEFSVSRLTVQRAIRELVSEGLLRRAQGSGTFVNDLTHRFPLIEVHDVADDIHLLGGKASTEVLLHRRMTPADDVTELLALEKGSDVFQVALLQSMDGKPVAYEERFAVLDVYPDFLDQDFNQTKVFDYLASRSKLETIENIVAAIHADKKLANLLEISSNEPCLRTQRRNRFNGQYVTLTRITYAGSRQVLCSRYNPLTI